MRERHPKSGAALTAGSEIARMSRLWAQVAHPTHGHVYDLEAVPRGLEGLTRASSREETQRIIAEEWLRSKTQPTLTCRGRQYM